MRKPARRPDLSACPLDDELVLYEPTRGQPYLLNATAAESWAWCDGTHDVPALARLLAKAHGLPAEQALRDVRDCLADLRQAGLLAP